MIPTVSTILLSLSSIGLGRGARFQRGRFAPRGKRASRPTGISEQQEVQAAAADERDFAFLEVGG